MAPNDEESSYDDSEGEPKLKQLGEKAIDPPSDDVESYSSGEEVEVALAPTTEEQSSQGEKPLHDHEEIRYYRLTLASNIWFLIASVLYLWLAIITFQYYDQLQFVPAWVLTADDDYSWIGFIEDDYVFQAGSQWVSRYMIVYFVAALGFVITGILDFIKLPSFVGVFFIFAGGFGLASAICTDVNPRLAIIFSAVSVHLFMVEAIGLLFRRSFFGGLELWLRLSDCFFLIGSLMDVAISYTLIFDVFNTTLAVLGIVAACLWVLTALIYVGSTYYIQYHTGFESAMHHDKSSENTQVDPDLDEGEEEPMSLQQQEMSADNDDDESFA